MAMRWTLPCLSVGAPEPQLTAHSKRLHWVRLSEHEGEFPSSRFAEGAIGIELGRRANVEQIDDA